MDLSSPIPIDDFNLLTINSPGLSICFGLGWLQTSAFTLNHYGLKSYTPLKKMKFSFLINAKREDLSLRLFAVTLRPLR